jgi:hypothetical protein
MNFELIQREVCENTSFKDLKDRFSNLDAELRCFVVVCMADGEKVILSCANFLQGVCDDCSITRYYELGAVSSYEIYKIAS